MNTNRTPRFRQILPGFYALGLDIEIIRDAPGALWEVRKDGALVTLAGSLRDAKALAVTL